MARSSTAKTSKDRLHKILKTICSLVLVDRVGRALNLTDHDAAASIPLSCQKAVSQTNILMQHGTRLLIRTSYPDLQTIVWKGSYTHMYTYIHICTYNNDFQVKWIPHTSPNACDGHAIRQQEFQVNKFRSMTSAMLHTTTQSKWIHVKTPTKLDIELVSKDLKPVCPAVIYWAKIRSENIT